MTTTAPKAPKEAAPQHTGTIELDPAPPTNPFAKVVRDIVHNMDHAKEFPPGPKFRQLSTQIKLAANPLSAMLDVYNQYGGVFSLYAAHQRQVMVVSPKGTREIQVEKADSFNWRGGNFGELAAFLGEGVLTSDGEIHDRARRLMDPGFHRARMEEHLELIFTEAAHAVDTLTPGAVININEWVRALAMRIAMRALVGFDNTQEELAAHAAEQFEIALAAFGGNVSRLFRGPASNFGKMLVAKTELNRIVSNQIAVTRARTEPSADLLTVLVETTFDDGTGYSDQEITDQVMTLLFAGHDTTSSTIAFLLYLLAHNPTISDDIREQIRAATDSTLSTGASTRSTSNQTGPLTLSFGELFGSMPLLSQSIDETLRLYPAVWIGARQATKDVTIDGHFIPAGTAVNYLPWITHHLPELWDNPEAFRPSRFTPENKTKIQPGAYIPFGAGARICLGQRFGLTVTHAVAATLLNRFRMEITPHTKLELANVPTLTPINQLLLRAVEVA